jgi:hypothetical protein
MLNKVAPVWANIRSFLYRCHRRTGYQNSLAHKYGYSSYRHQRKLYILHLPSSQRACKAISLLLKNHPYGRGSSPPVKTVIASLRCDLSCIGKSSVREGFISSRRSCPYECFESTDAINYKPATFKKKGNKIIQCNQTTKPTLLKSRPSLPRK